MQTSFSLAQLADPDIAEADKILRACVHCGFCTATCPTYLLLGDELDSPRGRIYLIKSMLEGDKPASERVVRHIDRCLSCLACMTTCPSSVHYMHLVDQARVRIERTFRRPALDRWLRRLLAFLLPHPTRFRLALIGASLVRPLAPLFQGRLGAMLKLAPKSVPGPSAVDLPQVFKAEGRRRRRVALLSGCAQQVLAPEINEATIRLLTRHGCEVIVAKGVGCCGALIHHMGRERDALDQAKSNIEAWWSAHRKDALDAVVINASGCGTMVKDYGYLLRTDAAWAEKAKTVSSLAKDVSEVMAGLGLNAPKAPLGVTVAYHSACSLQHGQKVNKEPRALLAEAGCTVLEVPDAHLCCGSAGTYNLLQPDLAHRLGRRKAAAIATTGAELVAAGNIGCIAQIQAQSDLPVLHTVELLDWATGGPKPARLGS
jgi:glycolate oxidase iron-sulfur subunit